MTVRANPQLATMKYSKLPQHGRPVIEEVRIIPGPYGLLRVGVDDDEIHRIHMENVMHLEGHRHKDRLSYYFVSMERRMDVYTPSGKIKREWQMVPHWLILHKSFYDAILAFEEEHGKRFWIPQREPTIQLGVGRVHNSETSPIVQIARVAKDCVLGLET